MTKLYDIFARSGNTRDQAQANQPTFLFRAPLPVIFRMFACHREAETRVELTLGQDSRDAVELFRNGRRWDHVGNPYCVEVRKTDHVLLD